MRDFFSESNLYKSAGLSALVTLMSAGRLAQGGKPLDLYLPIMFLVMMFVSGAVAAWGRCAGMAGIVTDRRTLLRGVAIAMVLSLLALPVYVFWLDPLLRNALLEAKRDILMDLSYPPTTIGRLSLALWSAGFQVVFLQAAPMSLFARLTGRHLAAVGLCVALRAYIAHLQIAEAGITDGVPLFFASALATTAAGCILFAGFGLAPTMLFAAGLNLNVFFTATTGR